MRRFHLFEWEDQPWLPAVFRDFITDHIQYTLNEPMRRPINRAIALRLKTVLEEVQNMRLIDLCAGAGGPLVDISRILIGEMRCSVEVLVTDLYPNIAAFQRLERESHGAIRARYESTSASDVPSELTGVRTIFSALHHFTPEQARRLFTDAVCKHAAVAVFEPLERTFRMAALLGIMSFIRGFTHTPRVGKLTPARFFFTYVCPLAPVIFAWDGMVSALRTYTPEELLAIGRSTSSGGYTWEAGKFEVPGPYGRMPTIYLIGMPGQA